VHLCVSLKAGAGSNSSMSFSGGAGFTGEMPALSIAHGAMFCPINCTGAANMVLAYGRMELTLAMFARRVLMGLSSVMWYFIGLPTSEGGRGK
jgi:hypothetical protein